MTSTAGGGPHQALEPLHGPGEDHLVQRHGSQQLPLGIHGEDVLDAPAPEGAEAPHDVADRRIRSKSRDPRIHQSARAVLAVVRHVAGKAVERVGLVDTLLRDGERSWTIPNARLLDEVVQR